MGEETVAYFLKSAVLTDGEHHKQYFLEEIARLLGIELPEHEKGIPD